MKIFQSRRGFILHSVLHPYGTSLQQKVLHCSTCRAGPGFLGCYDGVHLRKQSSLSHLLKSFLKLNLNQQDLDSFLANNSKRISVCSFSQQQKANGGKNHIWEKPSKKLFLVWCNKWHHAVEQELQSTVPLWLSNLELEWQWFWGSMQSLGLWCPPLRGVWPAPLPMHLSRITKLLPHQYMSADPLTFKLY